MDWHEFIARGVLFLWLSMSMVIAFIAWCEWRYLKDTDPAKTRHTDEGTKNA